MNIIVDIRQCHVFVDIRQIILPWKMGENSNYGKEEQFMSFEVHYFWVLKKNNFVVRDWNPIFVRCGIIERLLNIWWRWMSIDNGLLEMRINDEQP